MKDDDLLRIARERLEEAEEADRDNREEALDDLEFAVGRQWPDNEKTAREAAGRPVITINRMPQFIRQVTGDLRRLNPAIKVSPGDQAASPEVSEVIEGLVRQVEYASDATSIYEDAATSAATCGMGHFRVLTDYEDENSFDQCIKIEPIRNPFAVYWDPMSRDPTRKDAGYCFVTERMSKEQFEAQFPDATATSVDVSEQTSTYADWYMDGDVLVAEYFWKKPSKKTLYKLSTGQVVTEKRPGDVVLMERKVDVETVMWAKISGVDVLDGPREMPSKYIPVISVMGEEVMVGEEVVRTSVIRYAKDPQRLYNYYKSAHTEFVALQPKAPFLVTGKQVAGFETFWNEANDSNRPYLPYNPDEKAPGPPSRAVPPQPSMAMLEEMRAAAEDMKSTTGIFDAGLGNRSNEQSGVAIRQRQLESDVSTSIYSDNLSRSIAHCGTIIVDMIPKIYDTPRSLRIIGKDQAEETVRVNDMAFDQNGNMVMVNPLNVGRYDVRVSVGPNYSTRRQEVAESLMEFMQAVPQVGQVAADLVVRAMDFPDADKLAERLEKTLPPGIMPQKQPETQEEMQAMQQQMQMQQMQEQLGQRKAQAEVVKAEAEAKEAQADAVKAEAEAQGAIMRTQAMMQPVVQPPLQRPF